MHSRSMMGKTAATVASSFKAEMFGVLSCDSPPNHQHREAHTRPEVLVLQDAAPALWLASCLMASFISWLHPEAKRGESSVEGPLRGSDVFNVPWGTCSVSVNNGFISWLIIDSNSTQW